MEYCIENAILKVTVSDRGGELQSIRRDGGEYLWQADPTYWEEKAPNLFPYIARLTDGKYTLNGRTYELPIHGFVHTSVLRMEEKSGERIVFRLDADEETKRCYPFDFTYRIIYELDEEVLHVTYQVENHGKETMYFGIGGHPGFCVPLGEGADEDLPAFEEHYLEFDGEQENGKDRVPMRIGFSPACFLNGEDTEYPLRDGKRIMLRHDLFDEDAIVLTNAPRAVSLRSVKGDRSVRVTYPDMEYIGFWHAVKRPAPYVCIEPWSSLPSRQDVVEDLATQPGLVSLGGGKIYRNGWSVEIH